jgi:hypothetical protein
VVKSSLRWEFKKETMEKLMRFKRREPPEDWKQIAVNPLAGINTVSASRTEALRRKTNRNPHNNVTPNSTVRFRTTMDFMVGAAHSTNSYLFKPFFVLSKKLIKLSKVCCCWSSNDMLAELSIRSLPKYPNCE